MGKNRSPRVSVIIPTYNRAQLLRLTVESVLAQTYPNIELIVVDDGSTDDTAEAMAHYAGRLVYIRQENQGATAALYRGFALSSGEYIAFLDHDDLFMPTKIEEQVQVLNSNPDIALCHCGFSYIDEKGDPLQNFCLLPDTDILKELVLANFIWSGGPLIRRECLDDVGLGDEALWCSDYDLWLRLAFAGYRFYCIQKPLGAYRILSNSQMSNVHGLEHGLIEILDRVYSRSELPAEVLAVRDEAYGGIRFQLGCWYYAVGLWDEAQRNLRAALTHGFFAPGASAGFPPELVKQALGYRIRQPMDFAVNVFDHLPPEASHLAAYREQALAYVHAGIALRHFARGAVETAQRELIRASDTYPPLLAQHEAFAEFFGHEVMKLPLSDPLASVNTVLDNLPTQVKQLGQVRSRVLADVSVACAFQDYFAGRYALALRRVLGGVGRRPSWLGNKGVPAVLVKSLLGLLRDHASPEWRVT